MADPERELLILMTRGTDPVEAVMAAGGRVTQRLADRIALAVVPAGAQTLIERSDVLNVFDEDVPEAAVEDLDEAERIFVDAWRKRARPKDRTGDGMRWDAPGFEAP